MENKDIKYLILIALGVYLLTSYIIGSLDPFDSWKFTRLIQVAIFGVLGFFYLTNKK
jgi:hypothetical protein